MRARRTIITVIAVIAFAAIIVAGISQAPKSSKSKRVFSSVAEAQRVVAGAPAPLDALYAQASQLLGGGKDAIQARIASFKGRPVVVNKWASWCGPCRAEFPLFQRATQTYGKRIAFIGLNSGDNDASARAFLAQFPVPYPSYTDPHERAAAALRASTGYPITLYYDATGKEVAIHAGEYLSQLALEQDLRRYLLAKGA